MKLFDITCALLLLFAACSIASERPQWDLILLTRTTPPSKQSADSIVRYTLRDGHYEPTGHIKSYAAGSIHFPSTDNVVYRNRFIISETGEVLDIEKQRIVNPSTGTRIAVDGSILVYSRYKYRPRDFSRPEQVRTWDLDKSQFVTIEQKKQWIWPGIPSPDRKRSAVFSFDQREYDDIQNQKATPILTVNGDTGRIFIYQDSSDTVLELPFQAIVDVNQEDLERMSYDPWEHIDSRLVRGGVWVDNSQLVSQRHNGEIYLVGLDGSSKHIISIPTKESPVLGSFFWQNQLDQIIYKCGSENVLIHPILGTWSTYEWHPVGNQFYIRWNADDHNKREIRRGTRIIGKFVAGVNAAITTENCIAINTAGNELMVWTSWTHQWQTIPNVVRPLAWVLKNPD